MVWNQLIFSCCVFVGAGIMFINESGIIAQIMQSGTHTITGSMYLTIFIVLIFLIIICMMFSIPLEFLSIIILPFCISIMAYYSNFIAPVGVILIYLTTIITKNWLFK